MKILVKGSIRHLPDDKNEIYDDFKTFCRHIGQCIAEKKYILVTSDYDENTADRHVVDGMNNVDGLHKVIVIYFKGRENLFKNHKDYYKNIIFESKKIEGNYWDAGRVEQVINSDIVICVGGTRGTETSAYIAQALGKAVLPIPCFGGSAEQLYSEIRLLYEQKKIITNHYNWDEFCSNLSINITTELIKNTVKNNPFQPYKIMPLYFFVCIVFLCFVIWIYLYTRPAFIPIIVIIFSLLCVSTCLGVSLKNIHFLLNNKSDVTFRRTFLESLAGMLIGFGLSIFYFIGQFMVVGNISPDHLDNAGSFNRVSLIMSLVGFFSGFKLDNSLNFLAKKMEQIIW